MNDQQSLTEKHEEARREILALKDKTPISVILNFFDRWFPQSVPEHGLIYWLLQITLINVIYILPGFLLAWVFGDIKQWSSDIRAWLTAVELAIYGFLLSYGMYRLTYNGIANHIIYKVTNSEDINALIALLTPSTLSAYGSVFLGGILWSAWALTILPEYRIVGLIYMVILTGCLIGVSSQAVFWAMRFANQLKGLRYELNTFTPANSEVIVQLTGVLNMVIYLTGAFFIVLTLLVSSGFFGSLINKTLGLPLTLLGGIIILIQFFVHRSTISGIVEKERWASLNKLQLQMNTIQASEDLSAKDVSEKLLRLTDLHEKIRSERSGAFDFKSILSLFSQLMLPLLGLLLGNLDKLINLLK